MRLDQNAAACALEEYVAAPLGVDLVSAAAGVLRVTTTNMVYAIRALTVERGIDPREFVLCSYGGGGGLFAAEVAGQLGVESVVIPPHPAIFSAFGILGSDYRADASATRIRAFDGSSVNEVEHGLNTLAEQVSSELGELGYESADVRRPICSTCALWAKTMR